MSELIIAEHLAQSRKAVEHEQINRFGTIEKHLAVLQTRFEAWVERAVQGEDLKELKREMEAEVNKQIGHVCDHFDNQTEQQSKDILARVEGMFQTQQAQIAEANRRTRVEIIRYGVAFATSVLGALTVIWLTR